jgi:hypothetical protein
MCGYYGVLPVSFDTFKADKIEQTDVWPDLITEERDGS